MNAKEIIRKLIWIMIVIFLLCDFAIGQMGAFQVVPPERIPEILNTISTRVHQNFVQIHSLEGEIQVSWYQVYKGERAKRIFESRTNAVGDSPNRIAELRESTTTFRSDFEKELLYAKVSRKTPSRYIDLADNRDLGTKSIPWWRISISTPEYHLHSSPNRMRGGRIVQRRAVKEKVDQDCPSCARPPPVFDPRDLFDARTPVWLYYPRIVQRMEEKGKYVVDDKYALKVEQRELDGKVQYRVHDPAKVGPEGDNIWVIKTFSAEAGYNMISSERTHADGELVRRQSLEYQSVQGVYIPSKATYESFDPEDGSLRYQKRRTFKSIHLNRVIPAETFTYANLALENGDEFVDKTLDKKYTYQDGELIPATSGSSYMLKQTIWPTANLNGDCCVNWEDLLIMASYWLDS